MLRYLSCPGKHKQPTSPETQKHTVQRELRGKGLLPFDRYTTVSFMDLCGYIGPWFLFRQAFWRWLKIMRSSSFEICSDEAACAVQTSHTHWVKILPFKIRPPPGEPPGTLTTSPTTFHPTGQHIDRWLSFLGPAQSAAVFPKKWPQQPPLAPSWPGSASY